MLMSGAELWRALESGHLAKDKEDQTSRQKCLDKMQTSPVLLLQGTEKYDNAYMDTIGSIFKIKTFKTYHGL